MISSRYRSALILPLIDTAVINSIVTRLHIMSKNIFTFIWAWHCIKDEALMGALHFIYKNNDKMCDVLFTKMATLISLLFVILSRGVFLEAFTARYYFVLLYWKRRFFNIISHYCHYIINISWAGGIGRRLKDYTQRYFGEWGILRIVDSRRCLFFHIRMRAH